MPFFILVNNCLRRPFLETQRAQKRFFRSSGFRIVLLAAPSHRFRQWHIAAFVPGYGGGSATEFNRLPCLQKIMITDCANQSQALS